MRGELDRSQREHASPRRRHVEHLLVGDALEAAGSGHDARVGGEHPGDVGVDLADLRVERGRERHRRRVGAAASEGRDVGCGRDPLEAGDDRDRALGERIAEPVGPYVEDLRPAVRRVGEDAGLRAGEAHRVLTPVDDRHAEQRDRDALARGEEHVHLSPGGRGRHLVREPLELVGRVAHGGDHDDDVVARTTGLDDVLGDGLDALRVGHRGAAVLLHDEAHDGRWYRRGSAVPCSLLDAGVSTGASVKRRRVRQAPAAERAPAAHVSCAAASDAVLMVRLPRRVEAVEARTPADEP